MIKQLQKKITQLLKQNQLLQKQINDNQQHYDSIIAHLQQENQKLRKFIDQGNNSPINSYRQPDTLPSHKIKSKESTIHLPLVTDTSKDTHPFRRSNQELESQNTALRRELSEITTHYIQQIQQISIYFSKIKQSNPQKATYQKQQKPRDKDNSQLNNFREMYDKMLKEFNEERVKYIGKIEELAEYIASSEGREKQLQDQIKKIQLSLAIALEELKIYKRSKIVDKSN